MTLSNTILVLLATFAVGTGAAAQQSGGPASASANYVIGAGDRLKITVWNQENITGEYVVAGDGSFTFPLIGRVEATGLTLSELEVALRRRLLEDRFYKNPQVTAAVLEYRSQRIYVIGAVRRPGMYPLRSEMTLIEALATAESTTADAADQAFIIRSAHAEGPVLPGEDSAAEVIKFDLRGLDTGRPSSDLRVRDGDTVYVPRAASVFVYGEVRKPGSYPIGQDTTVRQALSLAGGLTEFGAANRVKVLRVVDGKEHESSVRLQDKVQAGDTIVVPERFF